MKGLRTRRPSPWALALVVVLTLTTTLAFTSLSPVRSFERFINDVRLSFHSAPSELSSDVVIIAIDDASLEQFPHISPIPRDFLGTVVANLDKAGVSVIGLDVVLDRATTREADDALASKIARTSAPVVLVSDPGLEQRRRLCAGADTAAATSLIAAFGAQAETAHGVLCHDAIDDVLRLRPPSFSGHPGFAEALVRQHTGTAASRSDAPAELPIRFATGPDGQLPFPIYSATDLDVIPSDWLAGRIAIVGAITPYSGDWFVTPLRFAPPKLPIEPQSLMPEGQLPGVVVHGYIAHDLLLSRTGPRRSWLGFWICLSLGTLAGLGLASARLGMVQTVIAAVILLTFGTAIAFFAFEWTGILLPLWPFGTSFLLALGLSSLLYERLERGLRRQIHLSFAHYLAPEVVERLTRSPELLTRDAQAREVTILFTDLEGFTRFVDQNDPDQVAGILNEYLDLVIDAVVRHGGVVDKIVGDAIHAMFSVPEVQADHRERALRAALDIEQRTTSYRSDLALQQVAIGRTRIGIASGECLVGNFGGSSRFDFTAHGSTINLAARLEEENKVFGTSICLSEATKVTDDAFCFRAIGELPIRGLSEPIPVYELLSPIGDTPVRVQAYNEAFKLLKSDASKARPAFEDLAMRWPEDPLVRYQLRKLGEA